MKVPILMELKDTYTYCLERLCNELVKNSFEFVYSL